MYAKGRVKHVLRRNLWKKKIITTMHLHGVKIPEDMMEENIVQSSVRAADRSGGYRACPCFF